MAFGSSFPSCIWKKKQVLKLGKTHHGMMHVIQKQPVLGPEMLPANCRYLVTYEKLVAGIWQYSVPVHTSASICMPVILASCGHNRQGAYLPFRGVVV